MSPAGEIVVVPFHSKGHTFPATELSRHLASRGLRVTLFLPSRPSSPFHANINVILFSGPPPPPPPAPAANPISSTSPFPSTPPHLHEDSTLEDYLSMRSGGEGGANSPSSSSSPPLLCAVVDVMMSGCIETCSRYGIPVVSFFTSSGCAAALEHAASKLSLEDLGPAGTVAVPGLPDDMPLTASDLLPEPPPPGGPQPPSGASDGVPRPPLGPTHPGCGCPQPPPFGRGQPGGPPPPFPSCHPGGPPPHLSPGHGGGHPPPPRPGHHHHHHPGGLLRPSCPPPPPPPHGPGAGPLWPPMPPPTQPPSPNPKAPQPGTSEDATSAPPRKPGGGGGPPRGLGETGAAIALLFNTCDKLEHPFLDYVAKEAGKPVMGVGPLLPAQFWSIAGGAVSDEAARPDQQQQKTTIAEAEVRAWLDSKPPASVIYISFGTLVGPTSEELSELAAALEESDRPFIWVLQTDAMNTGGYFPEDLARRASESGRGLVIRGWAPQLAILSHPSTAAFLSHCGWNSTVEALARGLPILAWPIKGDQLSNAKLVTAQLRVGYSVRTAAAGPDGRVKKEEVARGIERLMADEGIRDRAGAVRSIFGSGFPGSSAASIDAFVDFVTQRLKEASS